MGEIYLVRHTESLANVDRSICKYIPDRLVGLSNYGEQQIEEVCLSLREKKLAADRMKVFSSPYKRTSLLAQRIWDYRLVSSPPKYEDLIQEFNFGAIKGLSDLEWEKLYPENFSSRNKYDLDFKYPNGESLRDAFKRSSEFLNLMKIFFERTGKIPVVVSHEIPIKMMKTISQGGTIEDYFFQHGISNGELTNICI